MENISYTNKTFMNNLKRIRSERGMLQEHLASLLNVTQSAVSGWETGRTDIDLENLRKISEVLNVSIDEIVGSPIRNTLPIESRSFPLLGDIAAGEPIIMNGEFDTFVEANSNIKADFAIRVKGNSMRNARILDGDYVFIKSQASVKNGEIAAVAIDDEALLKRFFRYDGQIVLQSENPQFPPIVILANDSRNIRILGKAVAFQSAITTII